MSRFQLKGNFFNGQYHLPPISGLNAVEKIIQKRETQLVWGIRHKLIPRYCISQLNPFVFRVQMGFERRLKPFDCELLVRNIPEHLQGFVRKFSKNLALFYQPLIKYVLQFISFQLVMNDSDFSSKPEFMLFHFLTFFQSYPLFFIQSHYIKLFEGSAA